VRVVGAECFAEPGAPGTVTEVDHSHRDHGIAPPLSLDLMSETVDNIVNCYHSGSG
jgi:hypothetical protein